MFDNKTCKANARLLDSEAYCIIVHDDKGIILPFYQQLSTGAIIKTVYMSFQLQIHFKYRHIVKSKTNQLSREINSTPNLSNTCYKLPILV